MDIESRFKKERIIEFIKFGIVGVIATVIHYSTYSALNFGGLEYNISYAIGYLISIIFNFLASNYFTFNTKPNSKNSIKFLLAHSFNYILQSVLLNIYVFLNIRKEVAPLLVFIVAVPINFIFVKLALKKPHHNMK